MSGSKSKKILYKSAPMTFRDLRKNPLYVPVLASLLFHLTALAVAMVWQVGGFLERDRKEVKFHLQGVSSVSRPNFAPGETKSPNLSKFPSVDNRISFVRPAKDISVQKILNQPNPVKKISIEEAPRIPFVKKADENSYKTRDFETILLDTQERQMKEQVSPRQKSSAAGQESVAKNLPSTPVNEKNLLSVLMKPLAQLQAYSPSTVSVDPEEGMPGFTPSSQGEGNASFNFSPDQGLGEAGGDLRKYGSLDDFLDIEVYTYEDQTDHQKYYMIKIFAKKGQRTFAAIPKEIIFTIDSSLSISKDRLEEVKKGIRYCLQNLNERDVFNIVAFKDNALFFSPSSVSATPEMIKKAEQFVQNLEASEQTDVYSAFKKIVQLPLARVPSNVILISDGRPTYGVVDSREVINQVSHINNRVRPVFSFSGGTRVNRYLLDFVSYQNRGWSQFIKNTANIDKGLGEFYDKIRDPLFLNLRYRLNGLEEKDAFPRLLPDFYHNAEFTLFGTYSGEDQFSMQLLGDTGGNTKELIFTRSLKDAKKGNEDIKRGYAFNKVYYLINEMTKQGSNSAGLVQQINQISKQYGVKTPYSEELIGKDA